MDEGWFPVVSSLLLGILSVALVTWLLLRLKSANSYREFDLLPRYGKHYTSSFEIAAPLLFTKRTLPTNAMFWEKVFGICTLANGAPMIRFDLGFTHHLVVVKASAAKLVLMDKENVQKSPQFYHFLKEAVGSGLVTSDQEMWRDRRKKLAPTMNTNMVESYFQIFYQNSLTLTSKLDGLVGQTVDIISIIGFCTLDTLVETLTGIKTGLQKNEESELPRSIHKLLNATVARIYTPWYWLDFTYKMFPEGKKYFEALKSGRDFSTRLIQDRKKFLLESNRLNEREANYQRENEEVGSKMRGISLLDMMLEFHLLDKTFSLLDIQNEVETFLTAVTYNQFLPGYESTMVNMSFVLLLLGLDPTRLGKVQEELDAVLGTNTDSPVELDQMKDLTYLECVIKEAARLYPPVSAIGRTLQNDVRVDDVLIPKGTSFITSIQSIHRDPDVFPDPEKFIPERFLPDAEKPIDPFDYLPFSHGPRNCIGFRFAMLLMKVFLSSILRRFSVESLVHRDKIVMTLGIMQTPMDGLPLRFHTRSRP